ncbi:AUGMIN subunit 2-like [Salvia splendens]|uniref:AUGMIN subunit 2-like n=1 Tax=Salvia splendens TaxID=180675 RepID=UPI001103CCD1|nr:AUGMIN subunit 2-like [Salvia splendens]
MFPLVHSLTYNKRVMSMGGDTIWVGKKPLRRVGGMSDALSIAADLGFSFAPPPSQEGIQNLSAVKGDDLIRILRELTVIQRKIADMQVELQGRKEDKNVAHLTHVSEMEKKMETLTRITSILKDVIQNKKQFSELLMKGASDYGALTASVADIQWSQNFKEPPTVWGEMLRPIPVALASCTRFFEAMTAMRESFAKLQTLRVGHSSQRAMTESDCVTPPAWRNESSLDV